MMIYRCTAPYKSSESRYTKNHEFDCTYDHIRTGSKALFPLSSYSIFPIFRPIFRQISPDFLSTFPVTTYVENMHYSEPSSRSFLQRTIDATIGSCLVCVCRMGMPPDDKRTDVADRPSGRTRPVKPIADTRASTDHPG